MVIDSGLPTRQFTDVVESFSGLIDVIKLGWGTSLVTPDLKYKVDALREANVDYYFGGTLFEKFVAQNRFEEFRRYCDQFLVVRVWRAHRLQRRIDAHHVRAQSGAQRRFRSA